VQHGLPTCSTFFISLRHTQIEVCADPNVDIVYVASLHPDHFAHAEMALNNGKHVLVEKPMTMKASDAEALYDLGKKLNLFVGEGMWTRFFPAVEWARMHLGDGSAPAAPDDCIGTVRIIQADFCIDGDDVGPYPTDSLYALDLGGGVAWTVGSYVVAAAMMPFGKAPSSIAANGIVPDDANVGELAVGMTLTFEPSITDTSDDQRSKDSNGSPPAGRSIASGLIGYLAESCEETLYAGKSGRIKILGPAHCPTSATLTRKVGGRTNGATGEGFGDGTTASASGVTTVEFPLPPSTPEIEESGGIRMPNSMGFIYEAEAARRLIAAGQITFPQWTPEESIGCIRTLEAVLGQIKL